MAFQGYQTMVLHQAPFSLLADTVAKVESRIGPTFWENLKWEAIDDSYNLSRLTEVTYEFSVKR
jgi:hypothetical protein